MILGMGFIEMAFKFSFFDKRSQDSGFLFLSKKKPMDNLDKDKSRPVLCAFGKFGLLCI